MTSFAISEETGGDGVDVLLVEGYVDFDAAPRLKECIVRLVDGGSRHIVVDLTPVRFIDSTGIGVLVGALKRLRDSGGSLAVVCPDQDMRGIFELVGLGEVMPLHDSRDHAVSALARAA